MRSAVCYFFLIQRARLQKLKIAPKISKVVELLKSRQSARIIKKCTEAVTFSKFIKVDNSIDSLDKLRWFAPTKFSVQIGLPKFTLELECALLVSD